jgi:hypothetical protein
MERLPLQDFLPGRLIVGIVNPDDVFLNKKAVFVSYQIKPMKCNQLPKFP